MKTLILIMIALSLTGCTEPVAVEKVKTTIDLIDRITF